MARPRWAALLTVRRRVVVDESDVPMVRRHAQASRRADDAAQHPIGLPLSDAANQDLTETNFHRPRGSGNSTRLHHDRY